MWDIYEGPRARKSLVQIPLEILKRYEKWKDIVSLSGPRGLRVIRGFRDEALRGDWFGYRSSRLNLQYRVIYKVIGDQCIVEAIDVNAHDYRR